MPATTFDPSATPDAQLRFLVGILEPDVQKLFRAVRSALRKRLPSANELAYDYFTFVVISYSPTEHPTDGIIALAGRPDGVRLYLMHGKKPLPDPKKLLLGSAKQTRYVPIESASDLKNPDVEALIAAVIDQAKIPLPKGVRGKLVIRSISKKRAVVKKKAK